MKKQLTHIPEQNSNYNPPEILTFSSYLSQIYPDNTKNITEITFQVTEDCCMACTYCYQHHKTPNKMTWEVAKTAIDKLLNNEYDTVNTKNTFSIIIDFIGGEPLLEIELIEKIIEYTIYQMINKNHPWLYYTKFSIGSNGLLYNSEKFQQLLNKYDNFISVSITLDGGKDFHNKCRIDTNGNETYDIILNNILLFKNKYGRFPGNKITFSRDNINNIYDSITELIKIGYTELPANCVFEKGWTYQDAHIFYNQLKQLADYLINNNLYNKVNITLFEEKSFKPMDSNDNDNWCGGVEMKTMAFDYKGDIYPCIRYMESSLNGKQKPLAVNNVFQKQQTQEQKNNEMLLSNITRRSQSTDECFNCPIATGCAWCSGYNYEEFGTPNKRATYICPMHQARSLANVYYWNKLYKKLNIDKQFKMYIPKDWALNIINEQEYNILLELSEKGVQ